MVEKMFYGIFGVLIIGIIFILADIVFAKPELCIGKVIDKQYKAENNSTGTGVGLSNGKPVVISTNQHSDEQFLLMVKSINGKILTVKCSSELYYSKSIDNSIEYEVYKGFITHIDWDFRGIK